MPEQEAEKRDLRARIHNLYAQADRRSGGLLGIVRESGRRFGEARGSEAAAGMAYYTLFSLFPLLIALVTGHTV